MNLDGKAYLGCSWLKEKHIVFAFLFKYFAIIFCGELDSFKNKTFFAAIILLLLLYYYPFWLLELCRVSKLRNFSSYLAVSWKFRINTHRNEKYNGDWKLWIYIYIYISTNFLATFYELSRLFISKALLACLRCRICVWKLNLTQCKWSKCSEVSVT